jgi:phosphoribosylformimino-5-aminoimidazole carboxamide ribotide isomerase
MKIFPAIDLKNGRCVRLLNGDFNQVTEYNSDPIEQAIIFKLKKLNFLHIVDLDGAETGKQLNQEIIKEILKISDISIQVGGGIRSIEKIENMLNMGVARVIVGTAIFNGDFLTDLEKNFESKQIVLALDFKIQNQIPTIFTHGWQDNSNTSLHDFLNNHLFFKNILATDISLDGAMEGPNFDVYKEILELFPALNLIASGGIRSLEDLNKLKVLNLKEAVVGKAIYEKNISLVDLSNDY